MEKRIKICGFVAGLVFLMSGFAKSLDTAFFAQTIAQYGIGVHRFAAPAIVLVELFMGLSLLLRYRAKWVARCGALFLLLVTGVFLYGWLSAGVTDCGCFGRISVLDTSPWFVLCRNAVLLCLLLAVGWRGDDATVMDGRSVMAFVVSMGLGAFMSGYTSRGQRVPMTDDFANMPLADSPLGKMVDTSNDSTYLVFAFSYTCPHCLNSVENLKQYERAGVVDKVVGLALENPAGERRFEAFFKPNFPIRTLPAERLFELTNSFPKAYYIRHDSIVAVMEGEMPSAFLLLDELK